MYPQSVQTSAALEVGRRSLSAGRADGELADAETGVGDLVIESLTVSSPRRMGVAWRRSAELGSVGRRC